MESARSEERLKGIRVGRKAGGKAEHPDVKEDKALVRKMVKKDALTGKKEGGEVGKKWIQSAIKKPGALHKSLGVPAGEKIPAKKLEKAAEKGGNCDLTQPDARVVSDNGVVVIGYTDFPSRMATQASLLYATNIRHMLSDLTPEKDGVLNVPFAASCSAVAQLGGTRILRAPGATAGVEVTIVPASHDSTVSRELLTDPGFVAATKGGAVAMLIPSRAGP